MNITNSLVSIIILFTHLLASAQPPCLVNCILTYKGEVVVVTDSSPLKQGNIPLNSDSLICSYTQISKNELGSNDSTQTISESVKTGQYIFSQWGSSVLNAVPALTYPYFYAPEKNTSNNRVNDTMSILSYVIDDAHCRDYYKPDITIANDEWVYRKDGKLKKVTTHRNDLCDSNSIVYSYGWSESGKLTRITEVLTIIGQDHYYHDTTNTIEILYDGQDHVVAQVSYRGAPIDSLRNSIADWKASLIKWNTNDEIADRNHVVLLFLFLYTYENNLLTEALAYDNDWGQLICDTLEYNRSGQLKRLITKTFDVQYNYNKKGQLISAKKYDPFVDMNDPNVAFEIIRYEYSYDKRGRISGMKYEWTTEMSGSSSVAKFTYH